MSRATVIRCPGHVRHARRLTKIEFMLALNYGAVNIITTDPLTDIGLCIFKDAATPYKDSPW